MPESACVHDVAVFGMNEDATQVLGVGEAHHVPAFASVLGTVNPGADGNAVASPRFARPHPNHVGICVIDGDRANGLNTLPVEDFAKY